MKKCILIAAAVPLILASAVNAETRYFFDGVLGQANQKNKISGSVGGFDTISAADSSKGIRTGFYLNKVWGLEFVSMDYGLAEDAYIDSFGDTINNGLATKWKGAGFHGALPLSRKVRLTGRIGLASWKLKFTETDSAFPGDVYTDNDQGVDVYAGLGLRFDIEDNVRIALEYETLDFAAALGASDTDHTIDNVGISFGVLF